MSEEAKQIEIILDEPLRVLNNVFDELRVKDNKITVTRRIGVNEDLSLYVLENEVTEDLGELALQTFESNTYIYIKGHYNLQYYAKYIIKSDYSDAFITKVEANTSISETAESINLNVNKKLESYSTTEEMNSAISVTANEINSEVSKKVGENEIISKINQTAEDITIDASRININGTVSANGKFKIDTEGNMECTSGNLGGWNINADGLTNGAVHVNSDGSSTIYTVADLIIMRGYIMKTPGFELSTAMINHYDFNGDGEITPADYVRLQNLIGISMN